MNDISKQKIIKIHILKRCKFDVYLHQIIKLWQDKVFLLPNLMTNG